MEKIATPLDVNNRDELLKLIHSAIGTKFINRYSDLFCGIALDAVKTVYIEENGRKEIDIKRYIRVEKVNSNIQNPDLIVFRFLVARLVNLNSFLELFSTKTLLILK